MTRATNLTLLLLMIAMPAVADEGVVYKPGGKQWAKAWKAFYDENNAESDIATPLIKSGRAIVPAVMEAISHKDMQRRRYAITALGWLKDPAAVEPLTKILLDKGEEDYFRGDALHAIYVIDQPLGRKLAKEFAGKGDNLKMIAEAIQKNEKWLLESGE
jgi:HEAT repeat protein